MSSTHTTNTQYIPKQRKRIGICIGMYWDFNTCQYAHNNFTNTHANTHAITSTPRSLITRLKVFQRWKIFSTNPKSFTRLGGQVQEGCQEFEVLATDMVVSPPVSTHRPSPPPPRIPRPTTPLRTRSDRRPAAQRRIWASVCRVGSQPSE